MLNALSTLIGNYVGFVLIIASAIGFVLVPGIRERGKYGTWTPFKVRAGVFLALLVFSFAFVVFLYSAR